MEGINFPINEHSHCSARLACFRYNLSRLVESEAKSRDKHLEGAFFDLIEHTVLVFEVQDEKLNFFCTALFRILQYEIFDVDKAFGDVAIKEALVLLFFCLPVHYLSLIVFKQQIA